MSLSAMMRLSAVMLAAGAKDPDSISNATVVFTGLSLVFLILLLLIVVILIQGKIFTSLDKKKQENESGEQVTAPVPTPVAAAPAPVVEAGIPPEIVAAIVAAVNASTDGAYTLRAVTTAKRGRGSWGLAGVIQSTEPF